MSQAINKQLNINVTEYGSITSVEEAVEARYREENPEPKQPEDSHIYNRSAVIALGNKYNAGSLWVSVDRDRHAPEIKINHKGLQGSDSISLTELDALIMQLEDARADYIAATVHKNALDVHEDERTRWYDGLRDCKREAASAWRAIHKDAPDDDDDYDDDEY